MIKHTIEYNGVKYGLLTAVSLILFFFIMKAVGLVSQYELRVLNVIFLFIGVYLSVKDYSKENPHPNYLGGIAEGLLTSGIALAVFSAFVAFYLDYLNPEFMAELKKDEFFGRYLNPYIAASAIFLEGTISGLLISFILMQFYKRSHLSESEPSIP